jgi:hypothetical protein
MSGARWRHLARTVIVASALGVCATAVAAPASGDADQPLQQPLQLSGWWDSIATTPGDDTLWAVRDTGDSLCGNQLMSYRPGQGWMEHDVAEADEPTDICGVAMTSATDGWAVDIDNGLLRWNGSEWVRQQVDAITSDNQVYYVSASGPDDVWVRGTEPWDAEEDTPVAWHWDGETWQRTDLPEGTINASGAQAISPTDAWIVGDDYAGTGHGVQAYAIHWDGASWTMMDLRGADQAYDLAASSPSSVWASVDGDGGRRLMHWDGESWGAAPNPPEGAVGDLDAEDGGNLWSVYTEIESEAGVGVTTTNYVQSTDGETWTSSTAPDVCETDQNLYLGDIAVAGPNDIYTVGHCGNYTVAFHFDGETWTRF